jgi:hypothetical protein
VVGPFDCHRTESHKRLAGRARPKATVRPWSQSLRHQSHQVALPAATRSRARRQAAAMVAVPSTAVARSRTTNRHSEPGSGRKDPAARPTAGLSCSDNVRPASKGRPNQPQHTARRAGTHPQPTRASATTCDRRRRGDPTRPSTPPDEPCASRGATPSLRQCATGVEGAAHRTAGAVPRGFGASSVAEAIQRLRAALPVGVDLDEQL